MKEYHFNSIEKKWQEYWQNNEIYKTDNQSSKPKYYVLTMFPYPSGKGLHVGHPLGYVAADIIARYKKHCGFEVLHPMGFDAFGLPAEQYAIQTGAHPYQTTQENIKRYKEQLQLMGLSYDWSREVVTCHPNYYKFTQWIFLQMFNSWYNQKLDKALPISELINEFEINGNLETRATSSLTETFDAQAWLSFSQDKKEQILQHYRLAYLSYAEVNWCEALGTVLANDEVVNGYSERGNHPVTKKKMRQWFLRITAYSERLLSGLDSLDWPDALKEMQRNWIGKSEGASVTFKVEANDTEIEVFTTRPDTIFGVTFMVVAPESSLLQALVIEEQKAEMESYISYVKSRSERERMAEVKVVTGCFTGAYAINPVNDKKIPIYVSEYVLAGYGTGAIMAVPAHDSRDYAFAKKFDLEIIPVVSGGSIEEEAFVAKEGEMINSDFLNGLPVSQAISKAIAVIVEKNLGQRKINYRLRDAGFSRQRYWGEPFPIKYNGETPYPLSEEELPLVLPEVASYKPTGTGASPIAAAEEWVNELPGFKRETDTMPGYAGSSWYWLRYMDPDNENQFVGDKAEKYWQQVDLYIGGAEHAVGHLLYSRMWQKVLHDLGWLTQDEPFKKMVNQGMIQGNSAFVYRVNLQLSKENIKLPAIYLSAEWGVILEKNNESEAIKAEIINKLASRFAEKNISIDWNEWNPIVNKIHLDISYVAADNSVEAVDIQTYFKDEEILLFGEKDKFFVQREVEKMSKSTYNVVTPDDIIAKYGADTFRMYEMFLGPVTDSKPWNTQGIEGVYKFVRKFWNLFFNKANELELSSSEPTPQELKVLHNCIQKVENDIEKLSLNTCVSHFMIAVNELQSLKCNKKAILNELVILISPFAPHLAEELWQLMGNETSVTFQTYPKFNAKFLEEDEISYPIMINGKMRDKIQLPTEIAQDKVREEVLKREQVQKWLEGKEVKKFVFVPKRIINIVV